MSRIKDFLTCNGCYELLIEYYENNELDIDSDEHGTLTYECPICKFKNKYNPTTHSHQD